MRDRAWRRHIEERWVKKRISIICNRIKFYWRGLTDINGFSTQHPIFKDYIGREENKMYKTFYTSYHDSKNKIKYSPNKNKPYYRDGRRKKSTREYKKREFFKILKENGIK
jgi:hypothetical protein